jgi:cobalt-zinc-cadmium efflux system protein
MPGVVRVHFCAVVSPCSYTRVEVHAHEDISGRTTAQVLRWSLVATLLFVAIQVFSGLRAHSLALLSDAGHNSTDALALLLAWIANYLESKPANEIKTYGYQRAGVLAAFVNALTLVALSAWIFYESAVRLHYPQAVDEDIMLAVSALGLLLNGGIMWALRRARHHDLNVRSAFVHMLVWTAWDIIHESLNILLEGLPRGIALQDVIGSMRSVDGVLDVHDLHIWSLGSSTHALSCHVQIEDVPLSASDAILRRLNTMLAGRFHIHHTTVQFEHVSCVISESGCAIPVSPEEHHGPH